MRVFWKALVTSEMPIVRWKAAATSTIKQRVVDARTEEED